MTGATFSSSKSWLSGLTIWATVGLLLFLMSTEVPEFTPTLGKIALLAFCAGIIVLLLWIWFATYYRVSAESLTYRCGPVRGEIAIAEIRKISRNKTLWPGFRPALGLKGLIVYYNRWDEIYISPTDANGLVEALRQINPAIEVE